MLFSDSFNCVSILLQEANVSGKPCNMIIGYRLPRGYAVFVCSEMIKHFEFLSFHFLFLLQLDFFQVWWGAAAPRVPLNNGARLVQLTIVHHAAYRGGGVTH